jgi:transketolase
VARSLQAAAQLEQKGIRARVVEMHTIKPIDRELILRCASETGAIVTVEEHTILGGLGGAVAEVVSDDCPVPVARVGIADRFAETGPYNDLLDHYGLALADITGAAEKVLLRKRH